MSRFFLLFRLLKSRTEKRARAGAAAFLLIAWTPQAFASATSACNVEVSTNKVLIEFCRFSKNDTRVTLAFLAQPALTIEAAFSPYQKRNGERFWQELRISHGDGYVSAERQLELRKILETNPELHRSAGSLVDFLANFIEPNSAVRAFQSPSTDPRNDHQADHLAQDLEPEFRLEDDLGYTMICDFVGNIKDAYFSVRGVISNPLLPVGHADSRCRGRCGAACEQPFQWRTNQYTQECLNHDACRDEVGEQFGECEDEFWAAAEGYLSAPDCLM